MTPQHSCLCNKPTIRSSLCWQSECPRWRQQSPRSGNAASPCCRADMWTAGVLGRVPVLFMTPVETQFPRGTKELVGPTHTFPEWLHSDFCFIISTSRWLLFSLHSLSSLPWLFNSHPSSESPSGLTHPAEPRGTRAPWLIAFSPLNCHCGHSSVSLRKLTEGGSLRYWLRYPY